MMPYCNIYYYKFEDVETFEFFFDRINETVQEVANVNFKPSGWTADSDGAVARAIANKYNNGKLFGPDQYRLYVGVREMREGGEGAKMRITNNNSYTIYYRCQFHVLQCLRRHLLDIANPELRNKFEQHFLTFVHSVDLQEVEYPFFKIECAMNFDTIRHAVDEIELLLENPACARLRAWFVWWWKRRACFQELTRRPGAPTTNNIAEAKHRSWQFAGAKNLSLSEAAKFDYGESLIHQAKYRGMNCTEITAVISNSKQLAQTKLSLEVLPQ